MTRNRPPRLPQRGVASLVVVMVLLFIVALVAAYTSRNLIFEQRTSTNQYRSTQALEAAEAGLEWALAMLNHGRINASCAPSTNTGDTSFRQRYLSIDTVLGSPTIGTVSVLPAPVAASAYPTCYWAGGDWTCACPSNAAPGLVAPVDGQFHPAFRIRFLTDGKTTSRPGLVRIEVNGCTALNETCLQFPAASAVTAEGRAKVNALVVLASGLAAAPRAAVTVRGSVDAGLGLWIYNSDAASGVTVQSGGPEPLGSAMHLVSAPGTPSGGAVWADPTLQALDADRMFSSLFNMYRDTYRTQPAALRLDCGGGTCNAAMLRSAAALNPGRVFWVDGDLDLDSAGAIGSNNDPVMVYVNGQVTSVGAGVTVNGVIYSNAADWSLGGSGTVIGAIVAEGNLGGSGTASIAYDPAIVTTLRFASGSFVRVPGGWKDF